MYRAEFIVKPRSGVRDPQGEAVEGALRGIGYDAVTVHCVGRYLQMDIEADSEEKARALADEMSERLLVNPNLETYELTLKAL